jgi:hypothetical protein
MEPGNGNHLAWHDDCADTRQVALTINLSLSAYAGGVLEIREKRPPHRRRRLANVGVGDAILFAISKDREHRVTTVRGDSPKVTFTGWFQRSPNFLQRLRSGNG